MVAVTHYGERDFGRACPSRIAGFDQAHQSGCGGALSGSGVRATRVSNRGARRPGRKQGDSWQATVLYVGPRERSMNIGDNSLPQKLAPVNPDGPNPENPMKTGCLTDSRSEPPKIFENLKARAFSDQRSAVS
jgi:hypothetical protein